MYWHEIVCAWAIGFKMINTKNSLSSDSFKNYSRKVNI